MFKRKNLNTALLASSALLVSAVAIAETAPGTASLVVTNAFSLAETTPIDFGNIQIAQDDSTATTGAVTVTIPGNANPMTLTTSAASEASGNILTQGAPGRFDITGAAPFTALQISFPGSFALTNTTAPPSTPTFEVNLTAANTYIVGGTGDGALYDGNDPSNMVTDGTGAVGFSLGGTLVSDGASDTTYADGTYSGNYTMEVNY